MINIHVLSRVRHADPRFAHLGEGRVLSVGKDFAQIRWAKRHDAPELDTSTENFIDLLVLVPVVNNTPEDLETVEAEVKTLLTDIEKSAETLTTERKSTHGDWKSQSQTAWVLKGMIREAEQNAHKVLPAHQREALDMIATKISRIIHGNSDEPDHWDDIAGYAYLGKSGHK